MLGAYAAYHWLAPEAPPPAPEVAAETPAVAAPARTAEPQPDFLERLDASLPWRAEPAPPPPDPVVHCVERKDEEDAYVRDSECERGGGRAGEEPSWARLD